MFKGGHPLKLALLGLFFFLLIPTPALASTSIEAGVAATTGITRTIDSGLRARAQTRTESMVACDQATPAADCLKHGYVAYGEAEIIGWNAGYADPVAEIILQWMASPGHRDIMLGHSYTRIGCAASESVLPIHDRWYFDCLFSVGTRVTPVPVNLPNTAFSPPGVSVISTVLLVLAVICFALVALHLFASLPLLAIGLACFAAGHLSFAPIVIVRKAPKE
jgi:hypothetical protein